MKVGTQEGQNPERTSFCRLNDPPSTQLNHSSSNEGTCLCVSDTLELSRNPAFLKWRNGGSVLVLL